MFISLKLFYFCLLLQLFKYCQLQLTDPCSKGDIKKNCSYLGAKCDINSEGEGVCVCPPYFLQPKNGEPCNELSEFSYKLTLPLDLMFYKTKQLMEVGTNSSLFMNATENYFRIKVDIQKAMKEIYPEVLHMNLLNCKERWLHLLCSIELQFESKLKDLDQIKNRLVCVTEKDSNYRCIVSPSLVLSTDFFNTFVTFKEMEYCDIDASPGLCSAETNCVAYTSSDGKGKILQKYFYCGCKYHYKVIRKVFPFTNSKSYVEECEDVDECSPINRCPQYSLCHNTIGSYTCTCMEGYRPQDIQSDSINSGCVDVDECSTLNHPCPQNKICHNIPGSYLCSCIEGYRPNNETYNSNSDDCVDVDECSLPTKPCPQSAICYNTIGSYFCTCKEGYELKKNQSNSKDVTCADVNECSSSPNPCPQDTICHNTIGSYFCFCMNGYRPINNASNTNVDGCVDVDECSLPTNPCPQNTECHNTIGSYFCTCKEGYEPKNNKSNPTVDGCHETCEESSQCFNGGFCKIYSQGYGFCECRKDFGGDKCEINLPCKQLEPICKKMGVLCEYRNGVASCECPFNKVYKQASGVCEEICHQNTCLNGQCEVSENSFICKCNDGYTGTRCEIKLPHYDYLFAILFVSLAFILIGFTMVLVYFSMILSRLKKTSEKQQLTRY